MMSDTPFSGSLRDAAMWTEIEPCVGIICACLPTMRPLFTGIFPGLLSTRSRWTRGRSENGYPRSTDRQSQHIKVTRSYEILSSENKSQGIEPPGGLWRSGSRSEPDSPRFDMARNGEYSLEDMPPAERVLRPQ